MFVDCCLNMRVVVDKTRRDDKSAYVDHLVGICPGQGFSRDCDDAIVLYTQVSPVCGRPEPVDDCAAGQDDIEVGVIFCLCWRFGLLTRCNENNDGKTKSNLHFLLHGV